MFKIVILAYIMGTTPIDTAKSFKFKQIFETMDECKQELTANTLHPNIPGVYDIILRFIKQQDFKYDWVWAKCQHMVTKEEYMITPKYDNGIPKGIQELLEKKI